VREVAPDKEGMLTSGATETESGAENGRPALDIRYRFVRVFEELWCATLDFGGVSGTLCFLWLARGYETSN
jgi:hypothetical protein